MATYLEKYQQHLEDRIAKGGTPKEMEACLEEYNRAGDPSWLPTSDFEKWVVGPSFTCVDCQCKFQAVSPEPRDETRCKSCRCEKTTSPE